MEKNLNINNVEKITDFLIKNVSPHLIYLFGSSVNGIFREDSDIDLIDLKNASIVFIKFQEYVHKKSIIVDIDEIYI